MQRNQYSLGVIIIAVGIVIILGKLGIFSFAWKILWPLMLLAPGLLFHALFFTRIMPAAVLVPGGILTTYGLMFIFCNIFGWHSMVYLWPGFIFGVAVGLYEFYFFDRQRPIFIASLILAIISGLFFSFTLLFTGGIYIIALILILIGAFMLLKRPNTW